MDIEKTSRLLRASAQNDTPTVSFLSTSLKKFTVLSSFPKIPKILLEVRERESRDFE